MTDTQVQSSAIMHGGSQTGLDQSPSHVHGKKMNIQNSGVLVDSFGERALRGATSTVDTQTYNQPNDPKIVEEIGKI